VLVLADGSGATHVLRRAGARWSVAMRPAPGMTMTAIADGDDRLAAIERGEVVEYDLGARPPVLARRVTGTPPMLVVYAGDVLYAVRRSGATSRWFEHGHARTRELGDVDVMIAGDIPVIGEGTLALQSIQPSGRIVLTSAGQPIRIAMLDPLRRVAARPGSRYLIGAASGRILVWDLEDILPGTLELGASPTLVAGFGDRHLLLGSVIETHVFDAPDGRFTIHPPIGLPAGAAVNREAGVIAGPVPDGVLAVVVAPWREHVVPESAGFPVVAPRDIDTIVAATPTGDLVELDAATGARRALGALGEAPIDASARGRWVLVVGARRLWRSDGAVAEIADAGGPIDSAFLTPDGIVHALVGDTLVRWPVGAGSVTAIARTPVALHDVIVPAPGRVVARSADSALWQLEPVGGFGQIAPTLAAPPTFSTDGRCALGVREDGVVIADLVHRTRWTLARGRVAIAAASATCDDLYVFTAHQLLERWKVRVPWQPAELQRWLDARTNARASASRGVIEWVLPPS
jgi:hypothetical protein